MAKTFNCGHLLTMLQFGNMSDELTRYNTKLFGDKVAPALRDAVRRDVDHWWPANAVPRLMAAKPTTRLPVRDRRHPALSPALVQVADAGWDIVVPSSPASTAGRASRPPTTTSAGSPRRGTRSTPPARCRARSIGASVGGMLAAELAALRPEAVTALALLAPVRHLRCRRPGHRPYAEPAVDRMPHLFAKGVPEPFVDRFGELGPDEGPVARYLSDVAAASLVWPLGDRGQASRLHRLRCPRLALWGDQDELLPVGTSAQWVAGGVPVEIVAGAGHLLEWDAPGEVGARLVELLGSIQP